jgi:hypothetical protein
MQVEQLIVEDNSMEVIVFAPLQTSAWTIPE